MNRIAVALICILATSQAWTLMVLHDYRSGDISPARYEFYKVGNNITECPSMKNTQEAAYVK